MIILKKQVIVLHHYLLHCSTFLYKRFLIHEILSLKDIFSFSFGDSLRRNRKWNNIEERLICINVQPHMHALDEK